MAAYGSLVAWAQALGHGEAAGFLQANLDEETLADEKLTALAEGGINQAAADAAHSDDADEEDADDQAAKPKASRSKTVVGSSRP
jgi:hypothetical protein